MQKCCARIHSLPALKTQSLNLGEFLQPILKHSSDLKSNFINLQVNTFILIIIIQNLSLSDYFYLILLLAVLLRLFVTIISVWWKCHVRVYCCAPFSSPSPVTFPWQLIISQGESIYTMEIGKYYKSGVFSLTSSIFPRRSVVKP